MSAGNSRIGAKLPFVGLVTATCVALGGAGCGSDPAPAEEVFRNVEGLSECTVGVAGFYYVGVLASLDDPTGTSSREMLDSVAFGVNEVNRLGGVNGRTLGYVVCDAGDRADTATLQARLNELAGASPMSAIIGPLASSQVLAVVPDVKAARIPIIAPIAASSDITDADDDGFIYRTIVTADFEGATYGAWAAADNHTNAATFAENSAAFTRPAEAFQAQIEANGGTAAIYNIDEQSIADIQTALTAQDPTHVYLRFGRLTAAEGVNILKGAGISPELTVAATRLNDEFIQTVADDAYLEGARALTVLGACREPFISDFIRAFGRTPSLIGLSAYDAFYAGVTAMELSADPDDREEIRMQLGSSFSATTAPSSVGAWDDIVLDAEDGEVNLCGAVTALNFDENGDVFPSLFQEQTVRSGAIVSERCWDFEQEAFVTCP